MALNFKKVETREVTGFTNMYISYGIHLLKINNVEVKTASTGKIQIKFLTEGKEIPGFEGADLGDGVKAKGLVGRINLGSYFDVNDEFRVNLLLANLKAIAEKAGVVDKLDAIEANTVEDLLNKFVKIVQGKYLWFVIKGTEYLSKEGKKGFELTFKESKVGEENGKKLFQIVVKEEKFKETITEADGRIVKVNGTNTIGSSIGKKDSLEFNPTYDLKLLEASDKEADDTQDEITAAKADDLPF